ncbi:MAG: type IV pilus assembly protein FimV [Pseudomonadota bacterium]|uniref:type IV pilus assembly protein FimV n=1 Tax=Thermithiobacillus tepidarius TaxID=929 RepID=UPI000419A8FF|nr:hypothetical protein [Thermithiobacillus tepidarius]
MDLITPLLSGIADLPAASLAVIAGLLILLLLALLIKLRQRQQLRKASRAAWVEATLAKRERPHAKQQQPAAAAPAAAADPSAAGESADSSLPVTSAEVYEVDPLEEVEVYLAYGHLEQAAATLRWHVEHHAVDLAMLQRLQDIYLDIPDLDGYAEIQERLCTLFPDEASCREGILRGLRADPASLQLRVLAESYLGLDVDAVDRLLADTQSPAAPLPAAAHPEQSEALHAQSSLSRAQHALKQALINPEPLDLSGLDFADVRPSAAGPAGAASGDLALIRGEGRLRGTLAPLEAQALRAHLSPIEIAHIHLELDDPGSAIDILRRGTLFEPRKLAYHVELLKVLYQQQRLEAYAEALLSLYLTLWGAGQSLRQRLLDLGFRLGRHPLLEHLLDVDAGEGDLALLANAWGLHVPLAAIPFSNPPLVEERLRTQISMVGSDSDDRILQEFDQLLEFGQVEEAIDHLESAVHTSPQEGLYYLPLMEMYERMGDLNRFTRFTESILHGEQLPPEDTLRLMIEVGDRLKGQTSRRAV